MKVEELITVLQTLDPELIVVVSGYEGGVNEVDRAEVVPIALNVNTEHYYGAHEAVDAFNADDFTDAKRTLAVYIG